MRKCLTIIVYSLYFLLPPSPLAATKCVAMVSKKSKVEMPTVTVKEATGIKQNRSPSSNTKETLCISLDKGSSPCVNTELAALVKNEARKSFNQQLNKLENRFKLTFVEAEWLKKHKEIKFGIDPTWAPFEFLDSNKQHQGVSSDYVKVLNSKLHNLLNLSPQETWGEVVKLIKEKKIDILPCAAKTKGRELYMNFSEPYLSLPLVILSNIDFPFFTGIDAIKDRRIGFIEDHASIAIIGQDYNDLNIVVVKTTEEGVRKVSTGEIDLFIDNLTSITYVVKKIQLKNVKIASSTNYTYDLRFAVRKDWPELIPIINRVLKSITKAERSQTLNKWTKIKSNRFIDWLSIWEISLSITAVAAIIILFIAHSNRLLAKSAISLTHARNEAVNSAKVKGEFLANMSHEIRTPMNAIIGVSQMLIESNLDKVQHRYTQIIVDSAQNMLMIVNEILDISKIESGHMKMEFTEFNFDDILLSVSNIIGIKAQKKGLKLIFNIDHAIPHVLISDPLRLSQVLINLLDNAMKFTEKGTVSLTVKVLEKTEQEVKVYFEVTDTGIGLNDKECSTLFKPFQQADMSTTRKYGGTGLGLAISKKIIEIMNGDISVKSTKGKGSCFFFTVKFGFKENNQQQVQLREELSYFKKILIITGSRHLNKLLGKYIKDLSATEVQVNTGQEAISAIKEVGMTFDLIITTWQLPDMQCIELAKEISHGSISPNNTKIIVIIDAGDNTKITKLNKVGIRNYIIKPVTRSVVHKSIKEALGETLSIPDRKKKALDPILKGHKILLVEDNIINQEVAVNILEHAGLLVDVAENGRIACDMLLKRKENYDLVLMDLQMPVMDGYTATKLIRNSFSKDDLVIIAMSADAMEGIESRCIAGGMNDYIGKPIDIELMFTTLSKWLRKSDHRYNEIHPMNETKKNKESYKILNLDFEDGLQRCANNIELYRKVLYTFCTEYLDFADKIKTALNKKNIEEAILLSHSIKGVTGNIGAKGLYKLSTRLNDSIKELGDSQTTNDLLTEFDLQCNQLITEIKKSNL